MHILAIYQFGEDASMDVILVSGMDGYGKSLNSSSMEEVDEVTSKFTIDDVKFVDSPRSIYNNKNGNSRARSRASMNILRAMWMRTRDETGTEAETIRFLLWVGTSRSKNQDPTGDRGNVNAMIAVHDYNLNTKATVMV
eukprot:1012017_1